MPTKLSKEEARQGTTGNGVRYVLVASTGLAVIALALAAWFVIG